MLWIIEPAARNIVALNVACEIKCKMAKSGQFNPMAVIISPS